MKRTTFYSSLVVIALLVVTGLAQQRRMQLEDMGRIVRVSDPQIAPDGRSIALVLQQLLARLGHTPSANACTRER